MNVVNVLRDLVKIQSPSGKEDELINYIMNILTKIGYEPILYEVESIRNIILNQNSKVWIFAHLDTVPIKRNFEFDGKFAYGTGVCDVKGSIAAILLALNEVDELKFGVAFVSDEEEGGKGSEIIAKHFEPRKAIVMEPTSLKIANIHYGSLEVIATFTGLPSHGSMPEFGENAIEMAIKCVSEIKEKIKTTKISIIEIRGGSREYVTPDKCIVRLDFIFPPEIRSSELKSNLIKIFSKYNVEVQIEDEANGFVSSNEICLLLEKAIRSAGMKVEYGIMPSWTDAINLKKFGWDVVVFGPGELQYCHTSRERISIDEINKAKEILKSLNRIIN